MTTMTVSVVGVRKCLLLNTLHAFDCLLKIADMLDNEISSNDGFSGTVYPNIF